MWPIMRPGAGPGQAPRRGVVVAAVEVRVGDDRRRATSLKAMFCADRLGAGAIGDRWHALRVRSVQDSACIPPRLPPITAASGDAQAVDQARLASTQSSTVTTGKSAPGRPVAGLACIGPVEPKHEPRLLTPMTKKRFVSSGLAGADEVVPPALALRGSPAYVPATWCDAFSAWQTGPRCCARRRACRRSRRPARSRRATRRCA